MIMGRHDAVTESWGTRLTIESQGCGGRSDAANGRGGDDRDVENRVETLMRSSRQRRKCGIQLWIRRDWVVVKLGIGIGIKLLMLGA